MAVGAVGVEEEQDAGLASDRSKCLLAGQPCLMVGLIRGEGGDGPALVLVQQRIGHDHVPRHIGEPLGLVHHDALQVVVSRDVFRGRFVDGLVPIAFEVLAEPLGG